jgi:NDP-sugar pyrophosphorylase family protein
MKAMIFTAGLEGQLHPQPSDRPMALVRVNNEPLLGLLIRRLADSGFSEIIVNVHHFADRIIDFLTRNDNFGISIEVSDETDLQLDTGGGLKRVQWFFDDDRPFLVYNLEILSDIDLGVLYDDHAKSGALATLVVRSRESSRLMLFNDDMQLRGWENTETGETRMAGPGGMQLQRFAFSRIQVVSPEIFSLITERGAFPLAELYLRLAGENLIRGYLENESIWMDLGKKEGMIEAEKLFLKN